MQEQLVLNKYLSNLLTQKRWLAINSKTKKPTIKTWQLPENQSYFNAPFLQKTIFYKAFSINGEPDYLVIDIDHCFNENNQFVNSEISDFYKKN